MVSNVTLTFLSDRKEYVSFFNTVPYLLISCLYANSPSLIQKHSINIAV